MTNALAKNRACLNQVGFDGTPSAHTTRALDNTLGNWASRSTSLMSQSKGFPFTWHASKRQSGCTIDHQRLTPTAPEHRDIGQTGLSHDLRATSRRAREMRTQDSTRARAPKPGRGCADPRPRQCTRNTSQQPLRRVSIQSACTYVRTHTATRRQELLHCSVKAGGFQSEDPRCNADKSEGPELCVSWGSALVARSGVTTAGSARGVVKRDQTPLGACRRQPGPRSSDSPLCNFGKVSRKSEQ